MKKNKQIKNNNKSGPAAKRWSPQVKQSGPGTFPGGIQRRNVGRHRRNHSRAYLSRESAQLRLTAYDDIAQQSGGLSFPRSVSQTDRTISNFAHRRLATPLPPERRGERRLRLYVSLFWPEQVQPQINDTRRYGSRLMSSQEPGQRCNAGPSDGSESHPYQFPLRGADKLYLCSNQGRAISPKAPHVQYEHYLCLFAKSHSGILRSQNTAVLTLAPAPCRTRSSGGTLVGAAEISHIEVAA